jgi:hypothetical protein
MSGCCWVITIYAIEQGARPCGTPHDFVAAEAKSLLLMMSCVNCAHHIWYFKALVIAASYWQTYVTRPGANLLVLS